MKTQKTLILRLKNITFINKISKKKKSKKNKRKIKFIL